MKKLLVAVLACALFAPAFAVENVQLTGDIQTIGLNAETNGVPSLSKDLSGISNRILLGVGVDLVEDVYAKITFSNRTILGDYDTTGKSINQVWTNIIITEAYVNVSHVFDALEVKVGRQFYGDEKSAVIYFGPVYNYAIGNNNTSVSGATVAYNGENLTATAAYFSLLNYVGFRPFDNDESMAGLDLGYKLSEEVFADAYVYDIRTKGTPGTFGFWGVKPKIETDNFKGAVEFARNYGNHEKGWLVKADLALPMGTEDTTFTPRVTYLKSEKGFEAYGNYRPGLMFGTFFGIVNSRVTTPIGSLAIPDTDSSWEIINAGLCMKFANLEKWGFGLDFYTGELNGAFNGNSWEAKVVYNHNDYVAFNLTGAVLTNVKHFTASPTAVQLGMNIKF